MRDRETSWVSDIWKRSSAPSEGIKKKSPDEETSAMLQLGTLKCSSGENFGLSTKMCGRIRVEMPNFSKS